MGLFLGKLLDQETKSVLQDFILPVDDLVTHMFICGVTGSGKTVLGKAIIEEAALQGIPSIIIDLKGDLSSLGLAFPSVQPEEFVPWIEVKQEADRAERAVEVAQEHISKLEAFGISPDRIALFKDRVQTVIFTPTSKKGIPLGLSSLPPVPSDIQDIYSQEPETIINMIDSLTASLVGRLFPGTKTEKTENEHKLLYTLVEYAWLHNIRLEGLQGLADLIHLVQQPPMEKIGVLPLDKYISKTRREQLAVKLNGLLVGAEKLWYQGQPLDIETLTGIGSGKQRTQISIINLTEIDSIEDRNFVIAHLAYAIYNWMRRKGGAVHPRLLVYIDEIGGGGGGHAIYPSPPYNPPSKPALNLLLRLGRAFGVGCILATQNPGDIDYRGLSNCGTWAIGKLSTKRDRDKIIEGVTLAEMDFQQVHELLTAPQTGEFLVKMRSGDVRLVKQRWLLSYHKTIPITELSKLTDAQLRTRFEHKNPSPAFVQPQTKPSVPQTPEEISGTKPSVPQTPEEIYKNFKFGHSISEPFITVVTPQDAVSALVEKLGTFNILGEEISFRDVRLRVARIEVADWKINKIRRVSHGGVRERIAKNGSYRRWESSVHLAKAQVDKLEYQAAKATFTEWRQAAKRIAVELPARVKITKKEVQQDIAPQYGVTLNDVHVKSHQSQNIGYEYQFEFNYRNTLLQGRVDAVTGDIQLTLPVFTVQDAIQEVRSQFPAIIGIEGEPEDKGTIYQLTANSEDLNYDITISKHSCKVINVVSTINEHMARKIASRIETAEPAHIELYENEWRVVYESGQVLRIDRHTQSVANDQHVGKNEAARRGMAKAKGLDSQSQLVKIGFIQYHWQLLFQSTKREIVIFVDQDANVSAVVRPAKQWFQSRLKDSFPDGQHSKIGLRKSIDEETRTTICSYVTEVDTPRLSCTIAFHPNGEIKLLSKQVKREFIKDKATLRLEAFGVTTPYLKDSRYIDDKWHMKFMSSEGLFVVVGNEDGGLALDLVMSKQDAVKQAVDCLAEFQIQDYLPQSAKHLEGIWHLVFRDERGTFHVDVDADGCKLTKQLLTEKGALAQAAKYARGEAVALRKPLLSFGRYWVVDVQTSKGIRSVKIGREGQILE